MRRTKFCPKCGRQTEKFYDNLCKDCFLQKIKLTNLPEKIVIRHCKICRKYFGGEKVELNLENAVEHVLSKLLKEKEIQSSTYRIDGNKIYSEAILEVGDLRKAVELDFDLIKKGMICKFCSQKLSGYFNATVQIRNGSKLERVLDEVIREVERLNNHDELAFVSKIDSVKDGKDLYIGSKSAAHKLVNFLKARYRIKTKISRKQYGIRDGKKVFRDTILILLSDN